MEQDISPAFRKWIKDCLKAKFGSAIGKSLNKDKNSFEVAQTIIRTKEMTDFLSIVKTAFAEQQVLSRSNSIMSMSRPQTSMSFTSDLSGIEWDPLKSIDHYQCIIDKISYDKPVHVRLAGYEALLRNDFTNINNNQSWDILLKTLRDGIADVSKPIFEASLQVHAKLLNCTRSYDVFTNLLNAFNGQYHSKKLYDMLPTFISGINFKIFLHEKLFRIMHLIMRHQEEVLKSIRNVDKVVEEMIDEFIVFLCPHTFSNSMQTKTVNTLNIVSLLEPQANWSRKWIHSYATRKALIAALVKSPNLLQHVILSVRKGLVEPPISVSVCISNDSSEVHIGGSTIETATYLHCLYFLTQLCSNAAGRTLLSECQLEVPFSISDFTLALLSSLNVLASSEAPNEIYNVTRKALRYISKGSAVLYDARFYHVALSPLLQPVTDDTKIWPHTLDVLTHMLDTEEGSYFMISEYRRGSATTEKTVLHYPAVTILEHTSNLLRQPFSMMNVEQVINLFEFIGKLFEIYSVYAIVQDAVQNRFYPAITYLYNKMDKYSVENESKTQYLDSAAKRMLLKIVAIPFGLQMLTREQLVFEELIRGSITPLRVSWSCSDIVGFVSSAALLVLGFQVLSDLAPHVLSTLLTDLCKMLEDPRYFHDPWDTVNVKKFLHTLRLLSLNIKCFIAFMVNSNRTDSKEENCHPIDLCELLQHSIDFDSPYHYLALLSLNAVIWNMDVYIYLQNALSFQDKLLKLQNNCATKMEHKSESKVMYMLDECSFLRHQILCNSYYVGHKYSNNTTKPEECALFSKLPHPQRSEDVKSVIKSTSHSELSKFLQESKSELRDNGWVAQARKAHKVSSKDSIKNSLIVNLLDKMQKAALMSELTSHYNWPTITQQKVNFSFPEDAHGIELALRYAEQNRLLQNTVHNKENLKIFLQNARSFIKCKKPDAFEGFDWFLATVFIICGGNMDKCKTFITQIVQFPSTMFTWPALGQTVDQNDDLQTNMKFIFAQLLESIVSNEFPTIKYTLKSNCGVDWWMICNKLLSECFLRTLPWNEILHFFAICILYPPDYMLYYCTSLLHHCQHNLLQDITNDKIWPEHMILDDYRCHDYFPLMDRLGKKYRNKVLSMLTLHGLNNISI